MIPVLKKIDFNSLHAKVVFFIFAWATAVASADNGLRTEPTALGFTNIHSLWKADPNLTGEGIFIGAVCRSETYINNTPQNDYRFNMNHDCLYDADVLFTDGTDGRFGASEHATSIAGVLLGLDESATHPTAGTFNYRGACPDAAVNVYEFEQFSIRHLLGKHPVEEDIILLSLGDIFEDWWTRALEQAAAEKDFLVVASIGNGSSAYTPKPLYPGAGSNVLGVGVVDAVTEADGTTSYSTPKTVNSSVGPTEDNRCKPDIVAPGSAFVPTADSESRYELKHNWTSLASPVVAGAAALLEQAVYADETLKTDFDRPGKSIVMKAALMNASRKLPFWHKGQVGEDDDHETPLDFIQGAGLLDAAAAKEQLTAGMGKPGPVKNVGWDNRVLKDDSGLLYGFNVTEPNQMITATLCWNRVYQPEYPFSRLLEQDSDLRLELWGVDPNGQRVLLDYSDSVNDNVEHIYFAADPNYTAYVIRVGFNDEQAAGVQQRFALAWSVGADRQIGNLWWNDLNADNTVDANDKVIYSLIDSGLIHRTEMASLVEILQLTKQRLNLLTENWPAWKPYLSFSE